MGSQLFWAMTLKTSSNRILNKIIFFIIEEDDFWSSFFYLISEG